MTLTWNVIVVMNTYLMLATLHPDLSILFCNSWINLNLPPPYPRRFTIPKFGSCLFWHENFSKSVHVLGSNHVKWAFDSEFFLVC